MKDVTRILPRGLIVSCQALEDEPLHSPFIMAKMALAAKQGGAVAIRANGYNDIVSIKKEVDIPIIGIVKKQYEDSLVYITPTMNEIDEVARSGAQIIAIDATDRIRPNGEKLEDLIKRAKECYSDIFFMADISTFEEGIKAQDLGFDLISTTLCGYTEYTKDTKIPNLRLIEDLCGKVNVPVIAEGGIWTIEDLKDVIDCGAYAAVIGTAITRPREITRRFVNSIVNS